MKPYKKYNTYIKLDPDENIMTTIVRVSELFKKNSGNIFANYGLTFPQYNVLRILESSENGENTVTNVGKIMLVSGPNITGIAKRLEKGGFLLRTFDPDDERVTMLRITPKARQALSYISQEKNNRIKRYLEDFDDESKQALMSALVKILKKELLEQAAI